MKKIVILFSGLIIFSIVLSLLAMPKPALAQVMVEVDIKPGSCPNPLNLKKKGLTPVAIVGSGAFDATTVDPDKVMLAGVPAVKSEILDTTQPHGDLGVAGCDDCFDAGDPANFNCDLDGDGAYDAYCGDTIMDLIVYFNTQDLAAAIVAVIGPVERNTCVGLVLTGVTVDGVPVMGVDWVTIR